ncbi:FUSC family protein [Actinokineospora auranticolor]|uniref:Putative membrane protein YccC n=1 Tax=Actinokineospora auranticolor TaxID=155976 RepID=A0A2S6GL10_9PSEU|nr:FUSC family protein [Actinokineospora auranticolor]PPK65895.1 putative membrane protein YccC [Actinokineospora auranticolor]
MSDLSAPHWLRELLSQRPVPIPWKRALRAATAIAAPVAIGMLVGRIDLGVLVSIGALCVVFADSDGPYRYRAQRTVWAAIAGVGGYWVGMLLEGPWTWALVLVAGVSAVVSAVSSTASLAGLQLLVFAILGSGQTADPWLATGCFAAGAAFALVLSIAAWPVRGAALERAAVATVYDHIAVMLAAAGTAEARHARRELTKAINAAYDALLDARSRLAGRDRSYRRLFVLLTETTPVIEASVALVNAKKQIPPEFVTYLFEAAYRIRVREPLSEPPEPPEGARALAQLHAGLRAVAEFRRGDRDTDLRPDEEPVGVRERLREVVGRRTWMLVLRLVVCVGVAVAVGRFAALEHSYWVALTVAIVLKPDFGSVFGRAVLRGVGTAVGVLIGAGVLAVDPPGWVLVPLMAIAAAALPIGQVRNYGMFSTFVTPLVLVQLDVAEAGDWSLVGARLLDTGIGCAIVLVIGYLLWPGARRPRVGEDLAGALDTVAAYLEHALSGHRDERSPLRRESYRALSDVRTAFQQSLVEPFAAGRQAAAWWPVIVGLERLTDAVTAVALAIDRGGEPVSEADTRTLVAAVREAAEAVRGERAPVRVQLPEDERLEPVVAELTAVNATLRGPGLVQQRSRTAARWSH